MPDAPEGVELGNVWSNYDGVIDREIVVQLMEGGCYAGQPAWNYYGEVWFEDDMFHERVWVHNMIAGTIHAETIDNLQTAVWQHFGRS